DQVAGLGRQRDALVCVIEVDRVRRHADLLQRGGDLAPDRGLLTGNAFHGEKAHQAVGGGGGVVGHGASSFVGGQRSVPTCPRPVKMAGTLRLPALRQDQNVL